MSGSVGLAGTFGPLPVFVSLPNDNVSGSAIPPATAGAAYDLNSNGSRTHGTWLLLGAAADYECRVTLISGTLSGGAVGVWSACSFNNSWFVQATNSVKACSFTIEMRRTLAIDPAGTIIASARIDLDAESLP